MAKNSIKTRILKIKKRSGKIVAFSPAKIEKAMKGAFKASGEVDLKRINFLTGKVVKELEKRFNSTIIPEVEQVQDLIETILLKYNHEDVYRAFNLYRGLHHKLRSIIPGDILSRLASSTRNGPGGSHKPYTQDHISRQVVEEPPWAR